MHSMSEDRLSAQDDMLAAMMTPSKRRELRLSPGTGIADRGFGSMGGADYAEN